MGDDNGHGEAVTKSWPGERERDSPVVDREPALVRVFSSDAPQGELRPFGLAAELTLAGRRPLGEGIVLPKDERASRVHAGFERRGAQVVLKNESRNGTWVDGARVDDEAVLDDGAVVRMGDSIFVLRLRWSSGADADVPTIIGGSPEARGLRREIVALGATDARVLLLGETGTGKEVIARALHAQSDRPGDFVPINCGGLQDTLAGSALFGHRKGAFTGADSTREGAFHAADGGTLFLDELGELPAAVQPMLLRALDGGQVQRVGSVDAEPVDVRIVSATNRDLDDGMRTGDFRSDLFARLSDLTVRLPPLRTRREDVLLLLQHALGQHALQRPRDLSADLAEALVMHAWPYNVREVFKVAKELAIRGREESILSLPLVAARLSAPGEHQESATPASDESGSQRVPSRDELVELLTQHGGVLSHIARATGRSRRQIYRWLENHELDPDDYRES